ncbi:MAG: hypothetical protein K9W44_16315 [Candidatus Lokiarchaeota archaeon]|nr:hypothetical protein [Candidatus Harpocratesius repetitus]
MKLKIKNIIIGLVIFFFIFGIALSYYIVEDNLKNALFLLLIELSLVVISFLVNIAFNNGIKIKKLKNINVEVKIHWADLNMNRPVNNFEQGLAIIIKNIGETPVIISNCGISVTGQRNEIYFRNVSPIKLPFRLLEGEILTLMGRFADLNNFLNHKKLFNETVHVKGFIFTDFGEKITTSNSLEYNAEEIQRMHLNGSEINN